MVIDILDRLSTVTVYKQNYQYLMDTAKRYERLKQRFGELLVTYGSIMIDPARPETDILQAKAIFNELCNLLNYDSSPVNEV